jgi:hypothetical protein
LWIRIRISVNLLKTSRMLGLAAFILRLIDYLTLLVDKLGNIFDNDDPIRF